MGDKIMNVIYLFIKVAIVVLITAFVINIDGKFQLSFNEYEIYMQSNVFGLIVVLSLLVVWKLIRMFDWTLYVPRNFFKNRKFENKLNSLNAIPLGFYNPTASTVESATKQLEKTLGKDSPIVKLLDAETMDKSKRIAKLRDILLNSELDDNLQQIIAREILNHNNPEINKQVIEKLKKNGELAPWVYVWMAHNEVDFTTAIAQLNLAKLSNKYSSADYAVNVSLLSVKFKQADSTDKILQAWKKISKDKYINKYINGLINACLGLNELSAKQFKQAEKTIGKTAKWQGLMVLSVLAGKTKLYRVAEEYLKQAKTLDCNDNIAHIVSKELQVLRWEKLSDKQKLELVKKV